MLTLDKESLDDSLLCGNDSRATNDDTLMIVARIEWPAGVAVVGRVAAVPSIEVGLAAIGDLGAAATSATAGRRRSWSVRGI